MFCIKYKIETSDQLFQYSHYCLESLRLSALIEPIQIFLLDLLDFLKSGDRQYGQVCGTNLLLPSSLDIAIWWPSGLDIALVA